jgi:hypothetical protein
MMPRYYFHLTRGRERIEDTAGVDLAGDDEARLVARDVLGETAAGNADQLHDFAGWTVEITDGSGRVVDSIPLDPFLI